MTAPGIQVLPPGSFSLSVGSQEIVITSNNWNTIVATSQVHRIVNVAFAPGFNVTATTQNRFQYLADRIAIDYTNRHIFEPLSLAEGVSAHKLVDIAALFNPTNRAGRLTGLQVNILARPSLRVVASQTFYDTVDSTIIIAPRTIYFARLVFSKSSSLPIAHHKVRSWRVSFQYASFTT